MILEKDMVLYGDGDISHARTLQKKFICFMAMARKKHTWPEEADGIYQALGVLTGEVEELEKAIERNYSDEHIISEILDVITVATRMLNGEHITGLDKRAVWKETVSNVVPTQLRD